MWNNNEKRPIRQYLLLAFLIAWSATAIIVIGERLAWFAGPIGTVAYYLLFGFSIAFAPAYAVSILLKKSGQIHGIKDLWGRIVRANHISGSHALIVAIFFAIQIVVNILCNQYLGQPWYIILLMFPLMLIGGGMEELGWRGFLQPALEQKLPFFVATLLTGVIWAIWHLPLWLLQHGTQSSMNFLSFFCWIIAMSFVLAVLYKLTGSVLICVCFHTWLNTITGLFTMDLLTAPIQAKSIVLLGLQVVLAMIVYSRMAKPKTAEEDNMVSKILIHDLDDEVEKALIMPTDFRVINAKLAYATCKGCFGCWLHTPGYCVMKDTLHRLGADVMHADEVVVVSRCVYGGLSPEVKKVWDRCIPGILPFFSYRDGRMHHARRYAHAPNITAVLYGDVTLDEKALAEKIIKGNSVNFCAKSVTIKFAQCGKQIPEVLSI